MFYRIKENKLYDYADYKYSDECKETAIITQKELDEDKDRVIVSKNEIIHNPNYEQDKYEQRKSEFETKFFDSTLGYIRRQVIMSDGSTKDFLTDLLPSIALAVQLGNEVTILTYDKPNFSSDVTDWTKYQHEKIATIDFIKECFVRLNKDFRV